MGYLVLVQISDFNQLLIVSNLKLFPTRTNFARGANFSLFVSFLAEKDNENFGRSALKILPDGKLPLLTIHCMRFTSHLTSSEQQYTVMGMGITETQSGGTNKLPKDHSYIFKNST